MEQNIFFMMKEIVPSMPNAHAKQAIQKRFFRS